MPGLAEILNLLGSAKSPMGSFPGDLALQGEDAYQTLAAALANLDQREVETGTGYERQRAEAGYNQQDAQRSLLSSLANRGTLRSGITSRALQNQGRQYTNILDQLANSRQSELSNIAGQRIQAQGGYNQTMAGLQSSFAGKSADYIAQQVAAQAQREQNQQQQLFNQQLQNQQMNFQNQMLGQINQPRPSTDYSSILGALGAGGTTGPLNPSQPNQPNQPTQPTVQKPYQNLPYQVPKPSVSNSMLPTNRIIKPPGSQNRAV